jgi:hypothetical protein
MSRQYNVLSLHRKLRAFDCGSSHPRQDEPFLAKKSAAPAVAAAGVLAELVLWGGPRNHALVGEIL